MKGQGHIELVLEPLSYYHVPTEVIKGFETVEPRG